MIFFSSNRLIIINPEFAFVKRFTKTVGDFIMTKNFLIKAKNKITINRSAIIYKPETVVFKLNSQKPKITIKNCLTLKYYSVILAWGNKPFQDMIAKIIANNEDRFEFDTFFYYAKKKLDTEIFFVCPKCRHNLQLAEIYLARPRFAIFNFTERTFNYPWHEFGDYLTCYYCYTNFSFRFTSLILQYLYKVRKYEG